MPFAKQEFLAALAANQNAFGIDLNEEKLSALGEFYELVQVWNKCLHLVAPCAAEEFAVRHALESLYLLKFLPANAGLVDCGAGAGLPSIPCLIVRPDLYGTLVESSPKKHIFLREAVVKLGLQSRATCLNVRFEHVPPPERAFISCRALDKFTEKLPEIAAWAREAERLLLFGGTAVRAEIEKLDLKFSENLIPMSERRFLFVIESPRKQIQTSEIL